MRIVPRLLGGLCIAGLVGACHVRQPLRPPPRSEGEGAVYVYIQPLPGHASNLTLSVEAVLAERGDGLLESLPVRLPEVSRVSVPRQRLLAARGVPGGGYAGLRLKVSRASFTAPDGASEVPVPDAPFLVPGPFTVLPGRAVVLWLSVRDELPAPDSALPAMLTLEVAHQTIPEQAGVAVNAMSSDVTVFDVLKKQVAGTFLLDGAPGGVALDAVARRLYVSLPDRDELRSFDLATGDRRDLLRLRSGDGPGPLALAPGGKLLLVVNVGSRTVSFVDPATFVELDRVPVGEQPVFILVDHPGARAYVFNRRSSSITVLDLAHHAVTGTIATEAEPLMGALDRTGGRLAVVHAGSMYVNVLSVPGLAPIARFFVGLGASAIQLDQRTDLMYVAKGDGGGLDIFNSLSPMPIGRIEVPGAVTRLLVEDADSTLFALMPDRGTLGVVDLASRRLIAEIDLGAEPAEVSIAGERR